MTRGRQRPSGNAVDQPLGRGAPSAAPAEDAFEEATRLSKLGFVRQAADAADRASRIATDPEARAQVRVLQAQLAARSGDHARALELADQAEPHLDPRGRCRLLLIVAMIRHHWSESEEALRLLDEVIDQARDLGERELAGRALNNRALVHIDGGHHAEAERDMAEAAELFRISGNVVEAAMLGHNRALLNAALGQVPEALRLMDQADEILMAAGVNRGTQLADHCRVLLDAGLVTEALVVGKEAGRQLGAAGEHLLLADLMGDLGRAALIAGNLDGARKAAQQGIEALTDQRRTAHATAAAQLASLIEIAAGTAAPSSAVALDRVEPGATLLVAHQLIDRGDEFGAASLVDAALAGRRDRPSGNSHDRVRRRLARATRAYLRREFDRAERELDAGFRAAEEHAAMLASLELRAAAVQEAARLGAIGIRLGIERNCPETVLAWNDRARALGAKLSPMAAGEDPVLDQMLVELRQLSQDQRRVDDPRERAALLHRRRELEHAVRARTWRDGAPTARPGPGPAPAPGSGGGVLARSADLAGGHRSVADRVDDGGTVVTYVRAGLTAHAVVSTANGASHLIGLGPADELRNASTSLQAALERLARPGPPDQRARAGLRRSAARMHELALAPVIGLVGDRDLVVVPSLEVDGVPWAAVDSCVGRPVSVALSSALRRSQSNVDVGSVLVAAGPDLGHADHEAGAIAALYNRPIVLTGTHATVPSVLAATERVDLAHFCAHGTFRADSPLFSSLAMADGLLTFYDTARLARLPTCIVASACYLASGSYGQDHRLLGVATSLGGRECRTLIASVGPVRDEEAVDLMVGLHHDLAAGRPAAVALARAQEASWADNPTATGFVCIDVPSEGRISTT
ncbi:MAG: CHAT domain-containing protein [Acidimicrobiia bacterium]|nr:CHAT domain-containing protein [Acidimicrobiia bacterium]